MARLRFSGVPLQEAQFGGTAREILNEATPAAIPHEVVRIVFRPQIPPCSFAMLRADFTHDSRLFSAAESQHCTAIDVRHAGLEEVHPDRTGGRTALRRFLPEPQLGKSVQNAAELLAVERPHCRGAEAQAAGF